MHRALKWIAVIVAGVGAVTNLPALIIGFSFLLDWVRLHMLDGPHFRWHYLGAAAICLLFSGFGLGLAVKAMFRKNFRVLSSVGALIIGLGCMVALPEVSPRVDMAGAVQKLLGHADQSLSKWDEMHGQFPTTEEELRKAMALRPLSEPTIFFLDGKAIPYDVRITTNASGPSFESVPPNAGTIVYAVSADYKEYWLTITTLRNPIDGPVALEHIAGFEQEPIWVMNRKHHNLGEGHKPFIE